MQKYCRRARLFVQELHERLTAKQAHLKKSKEFTRMRHQIGTSLLNTSGKRRIQMGKLTCVCSQDLHKGQRGACTGKICSGPNRHGAHYLGTSHKAQAQPHNLSLDAQDTYTIAHGHHTHIRGSVADMTLSSVPSHSASSGNTVKRCGPEAFASPISMRPEATSVPTGTSAPPLTSPPLLDFAPPQHAAGQLH